MHARHAMNSTNHKSLKKIISAIAALSMTLTVVVLLNPLHAYAAGTAIASTISGTVSATGSSASVTGQSLEVKTVLTEQPVAGDYVEYVFKNVATTTLDNSDIKAEDGSVIGKLQVVSAVVPEVNKQSSGDPNRQQNTTLESWQGVVRAVFNSEIDRHGPGTTYTFASRGVSMPVVWSNHDYVLQQSITAVNGTGSIENTVNITRTIPATVSAGVGIIGTISFDSGQNMSTNTSLTIVPQKDLTAGDQVTINLSDASGIEFITNRVSTEPVTQTISRQVTPATPVNGNGAYIMTSPTVTLRVSNVTENSITVTVVSGTVPQLRTAVLTLGSNVIQLTQNNFTNNNRNFTVPQTTQTIAGQSVPANNLYTVQGSVVIAGAVSNTTYYDFDEPNTVIRPRTIGKQPGFEIPGYKFMGYDTLPNGDIRNNYHKIMTRFEDEAGNSLAASVEGTVDQKDIAGYKYISTHEDTTNGDTVHVYHKLGTVTETKTITRTIHYVDKVTGATIKSDVTIPVTISRTNTVDTVTGDVETEGTWSTGSWDAVTIPNITNYVSPTEAPEGSGGSNCNSRY
ncbi:hypothetical protein EJ419_04160 [Alloscardovia theropitheci]|uniref:Mub B2-like domain-containing protein n=1 Tax=Alloscardovia theropitheci TaxID=2496842 RepID=A0A4R0QXD5_9BIFI|nr:hypothetical protein [Alloscardovia theropitheci]TCD54240.1 hypothetical protein EJ419_04160 [Alloscardovia theropitheci]